MVKLKEDSSFEDLEKNVFERRPDIKEECNKNKKLEKLQELIFDARIKSGLSQSDLAEEIGTSQAAISRFESGADFNPEFKTLTKLLGVLAENISDEVGDEFYYKFMEIFRSTIEQSASSLADKAREKRKIRSKRRDRFKRQKVGNKK